jgi:carbon-monoxide dehydrogenase medium subunit
MTGCRYTRAESVSEVVDALGAASGEAHVIAGGIALGILMNEKLVDPVWLIDITRVAPLGGIERLPGGGLRIGATTTHREVESSSVAAACPLLHEMAADIACGRIKNRGTIGGNICLGDPQGDPPVALTALGASLVVVGPAGTRDIPIRSFFKDLYTTALKPDEILKEIRVPAVPSNSGAAYRKFAARHAMDYSSTVSAAAQVQRDPASGRIGDIGLGLGGVGTIPVWPGACENVLRGQKPEADVLARLREIVFEETSPIGDALYSADYKRHVAAVMLQRAVMEAYKRAGSSQGESGE